jgi:hypothetical protein
MQQQKTNILAALADEAARIPGAQAEATNLLTQAESERTMKVATAAAEAERFRDQDSVYRAAASVYQQRLYLDTLARTIAPVRKYILTATNTSEVITLNLEQKLRGDLAGEVFLPSDVSRSPNPPSQ